LPFHFAVRSQPSSPGTPPAPNIALRQPSQELRGQVLEKVSFDLALPLNLLKQPLHDSIDELRQGYRSLSECVEQAVTECEQRGSELADCRRQLAEARRSMLEQEKSLAERTHAEAEATRRLTELSKRFDATQAELSQAQEALLRLQGEEMQARQRAELQLEHNQQLQGQIEQLKQDAAQARDESVQLRAQFGPLTESAIEAERLRGELAALRTELAAAQTQLQSKQETPDLRESLTAALAERDQVETELDQLRHRAAELADALAEQKRLQTEQREQWSEEFRLLRRSVEKQSELIAKGAPAPTAPHGSNGTTDTRPAANNNDQVMDTVLQQFEMLQKNKVRKMAKAAK
jgi:chromosome segregation ATPase